MICGRTAWTVRRTPKRLISSSRSSVSSGVVASGACPVDARVGDRDVDAAEALGRDRDRVAHRRRVGHVRLVPERPLAEAVREGLEALRLDPDQGDVGAAGVEALGSGGADPAGGPVIRTVRPRIS